jgi:hypothetical protein
MMRKAEREELARVVRLRCKVAKTAVAQRQKELLADVERQLSTIYKFDDAVWADITRHADEAVRWADEQIARICRERGIPEEFRPGMYLSWHGRGENALNERRVELRRRAQTQIAAEAAKAAIEAREAEALTALIADGLESAEAQAFLNSLPTAEQLMPPVKVPALCGEAKLLPREAGGDQFEE